MNTRTDFRGDRQLDAISGYFELGMVDEAREELRTILNRPGITPQEFRGCVVALLQTDNIGPWRATLEAAYRRLKNPGEDNVRAAMLNYYFSVGEPELAFKFFPGHWTEFFDAWVMMQVCLELNRLDVAKTTSGICREILDAAQDEFIQASMIDALASYHLRLGDWEAALELWGKAPDQPCFARQRVCGLAEARALSRAEARTTAGKLR